ncbi:WD40/YVTN/BNR-like repeat-containing protein [Bittarella massiliensis (ex Durand et al. 2017)]|uniref:WD40/YVTN/BNR-like repeat-containing protein n=1 Tax=Bittarella massiliensis (ex Durand et al. 2017) TaxID=1720313 RepID=UPI001AA1609F|nr:hypothetical protein [Bittarella massiliensis (ex Durand et al. 2017)]MBO1680450.1 hypothetical protein [Bittarella massiliensis (ex Durand et al. 2017)]
MRRGRWQAWLLALALAAGSLTGCQQRGGAEVSPPEGEASPPVSAAQPPEGALATVQTDSAGLLDIAKQLLTKYAVDQGVQLTPDYPRNILAGGREEYTAELGFTLSGDGGTPGLLAGCLGDGLSGVAQMRIVRYGADGYALVELGNLVEAGDLPPYDGPDYALGAAQADAAAVRAKRGWDGRCQYRTGLYQREPTLEISYNGGLEWVKGPLAVAKLYSPDQQTQEFVPPGAVWVTQEKTAIFYQDGEEMKALLSSDQGASWEETAVASSGAETRFRAIGFWSDTGGYAVFSAGRTMSQEGCSVYLTADGGKTWRPTATPAAQGKTSLVIGAKFVSEKVGFLCYRPENGLPCLYRTDDGGERWRRCEVALPAEYEGVYGAVQPPIFDGQYGLLPVAQGDDGDAAETALWFASDDWGEHWSLCSEGFPDELLSQRRENLG